MVKYDFLRVFYDSKALFSKQAKRYNMLYSKYFDEMVNYFEEVKCSPLDRDNSLSSNMNRLEKSIERRINHVIGFIKTQEVDILRPLTEKSDVIIEELQQLARQTEKEYDKIALSQTNRERPEEKDSREEAQESVDIDWNYKEKFEMLKDKFSRLLDSVKQKKGFGKVRFELEDMSIQDLNRLKEFLSHVY